MELHEMYGYVSFDTSEVCLAWSHTSPPEPTPTCLICKSTRPASKRSHNPTRVMKLPERISCDLIGLFKRSGENALISWQLSTTILDFVLLFLFTPSPRLHKGLRSSMNAHWVLLASDTWGLSYLICKLVIVMLVVVLYSIYSCCVYEIPFIYISKSLTTLHGIQYPKIHWIGLISWKRS